MQSFQACNQLYLKIWSQQHIVTILPHVLLLPALSISVSDLVPPPFSLSSSPIELCLQLCSLIHFPVPVCLHSSNTASPLPLSLLRSNPGSDLPRQYWCLWASLPSAGSPIMSSTCTVPTITLRWTPPCSTSSPASVPASWPSPTPVWTPLPSIYWARASGSSSTLSSSAASLAWWTGPTALAEVRPVWPPSRAPTPRPPSASSTETSVMRGTSRLTLQPCLLRDSRCCFMDGQKPWNRLLSLNLPKTLQEAEWYRWVEEMTKCFNYYCISK